MCFSPVDAPQVQSCGPKRKAIEDAGIKHGPHLTTNFKLLPKSGVCKQGVATKCPDSNIKGMKPLNLKLVQKRMKNWRASKCSRCFSEFEFVSVY